MKLAGIVWKLMMLAVVIVVASCSEDDILPIQSEDNLESATISKVVASTLNEEQEQLLLFIFEEEKMARDVYRYLFEKWGANVFSNIILSEQTHKDAMEQLLNTYGVEYTDNDITGEFVNEEIQNLYDGLTATGDESLVAALNVGMFIEDFDIDDLSESMTFFENKDVTTVLTNLIKGSKNHLKAFYNNQLQLNPDYSYEPEFISEELYQEIIAAPAQGGNGR